MQRAEPPFQEKETEEAAALPWQSGQPLLEGPTPVEQHLKLRSQAFEYVVFRRLQRLTAARIKCWLSSSLRFTVHKSLQP